MVGNLPTVQPNHNPNQCLQNMARNGLHWSTHSIDMDHGATTRYHASNRNAADPVVRHTGIGPCKH